MEKLHLSLILGRPRLMCLTLCLILALQESRADEGTTSLFKKYSGGYFAEGGGLLPNLGSVTKRKVTARKKAPESLSAENATESEPLGNMKIPEIKIANLTVNPAPIGTNISHPLEVKGLDVDLPSNLTHTDPSTTASVKSLIAAVNVSGSVGNISSTLPPKKKGKPGVTYDEDDLPRDADGKVVLPKDNLIGSGPSFDYVVPIVIAMLAVPFVAVVGAFLYKKGRDFWDRRHYRRMDFLIDGMYND